MNDAFERYLSSGNQKLPFGMYDSVVRTLYANQLTMMVGMASMTIAPVILYLRNGDFWQLGFAGLLLAVGLIRCLIASKFDRVKKQEFSRAELAYWEKLYSYGGSAYVATSGSWVFYCFSGAGDAFAHLLSLSLQLCYMVGIIGRNFSSDKVVWQQVIAAGLPIIAALTYFGTASNLLLACFLIPFFFTLWRISAYLRSILFGAVISEREQRIVATRFNVALKNITKGVAMFDTDGNVLVANERFATFLEADSSLIVGENLEKIDKARELPGGEPNESFAETIKAVLARSQSNRFTLRKGEKTYEVDLNPMPKGGVAFVSDISEQVESEAAIRKLASFDPLTSLSNRRSFSTNMEKLRNEAGDLHPLSMYFIDLDKFKEINDTLGHAVGDEMLVVVASRLENLLPTEALLCRFGGDEFVVVLPGVTDEASCASFAEKIIDVISKPMIIDGRELRTSATVGISLCPQDGQETDQLLKTSDAALYAAKSVVRGSYSFYSASLGNRIEERRQLENDLKGALEKGGLVLHYQPLVNVHSRRISTCEALLRWDHPEKGNIPPGVFIPIAEETGLISRLSDFVLLKACEACRDWPGNVNVAVNISSLQFQQSDVFQSIKHALEHSGLEPTRLEVEVTESAMLGNVAETTATLNRIKNLGVKISLDDFGTGFSSLSYLHTLPLDKVKIDRSFITTVVEDKKSLTLLSGVTELTHNLGLKIVVEGIETEQQMILLCEQIRVDEMQGYLFGRAVPNAEIKELLDCQGPMQGMKPNLRTVA